MARAYSYSSIKTYKNCPKKFLHLQVKKDVKDKPFDASDYGSRAHKRVEEYILKVPDEKLSKPTVPLADVAFCTAVVDKMAAKAAMVAAELSLAVSTALRPVGSFDKDVWLRGKIDFLAMGGGADEGKAFVADWKFGKHRPDTAQLDMFAFQVFVNYPQIKTVSSTFVWAKDRIIDPPRRYHRDQMGELLDSIRADITPIETSIEHDNWPLQPSGLCGYCPVTRKHCVYGLPEDFPMDEEESLTS